MLNRYVIACMVWSGMLCSIWCPIPLSPGALFFVVFSACFTSSVVYGAVRMCSGSSVLVSMVGSDVVWLCSLSVCSVMLLMCCVTKSCCAGG